MYSSVKLSCPYEVRKSSNEPGDSKASKTSQRVSDVLMGASEKRISVKTDKKIRDNQQSQGNAQRGGCQIPPGQYFSGFQQEKHGAGKRDNAE